MTIFLTLRSLSKRKFISFLCVLSIALSFSLFFVVDKLRGSIEDGFTNSISNADLIVGSRSSPLQLLLYSIFHIGSPTNNITFESYKKIKNHPLVAWTIPISLGDSYRGHRVVATTEDYFKHYQFYGDEKLQMQQGQWSQKVFDVVLGSMVARKLNHKIGDNIILSHGISEKSVLNHDSTPFKAVGILKPTGTPIDNAVYITLEGMEAIHNGWMGTNNKTSLKPEQITAFILRTKNRIMLLGLQRFISTYQPEALSAVIPAMTLSQLWGMLDKLESVFKLISMIVIGVGFLTVLISMYLSLNYRVREMQILKSLGVTGLAVLRLFLVEAALISIVGALLGLALQYSFIIIGGPVIEKLYGIRIAFTFFSMEELYGIGVAIILGCLFGLIPSLKAYKISQHQL
jgi:putative ABC transport system permease protein